MVKKIEKLFKSYRDQLLHLASVYGVVEVKSYARSAKRLTITQLELLLIKNRIKLPVNRSSDRAIAKQEIYSGNFLKIVSKEFIIGVLNGVIFAIIAGTVVQFWFKETNLSILIAVSMVLYMIV